MNPTTKTQILALFLLITNAARAELLLNEGFSGYTGENLAGNAATGIGLTGNWSGSGFFKNQETTLSMAGVASSGGSLVLNAITVQGKSATVALANPLPRGQLFGSYLFSSTIAASNARSVGGIGVGEAGDNDNMASFVWSGNGYNNIDEVEGPEVRAEGSLAPLPDLDFMFVSGQTYLFLFAFNGDAGTTTAWVLNENQLAHFYDSLDPETLNAAESGTEDAEGIVWSESVTGFSVNPMTHLLLFGYTPNEEGNIVYEWDEIRISDASLSEAAKGSQNTDSGIHILQVSGGPGEFTITYEAGGESVNIERSSPGLDDFQVIATGENSGVFVDTNAPQDKAFYRLQPVD